MPALNKDKQIKIIHLNKRNFRLFLLILAMDGIITQDQIKCLNIPQAYLTHLKYLGLIYRKEPRIWCISSYGYSFIQGIPCATKVSILNQKTLDTSNKALFSDLFALFIKEDKVGV